MCPQITIGHCAIAKNNNKLQSRLHIFSMCCLQIIVLYSTILSYFFLNLTMTQTAIYTISMHSMNENIFFLQNLNPNELFHLPSQVLTFVLWVKLSKFTEINYCRENVSILNGYNKFSRTQLFRIFVQ